jgi:membrane associated rhomboid family serine protease
MMLLPIGHEETTVRRMPWVTLTIIGLCVLAFGLTVIAPSGEAQIANREREAIEFYLERPYLELDQGLKSYTYYSLRQRERQKLSPPEDLDELRYQQEELNALEEAVYAAQDRAPYYRWGLVPARQRPVAWLSHMLMHAGLLHLIGNLFILYLAGPPLEDVWGHLFFAVFYVVSGLVAALFFVAGHPNLHEPLIGASGAIAGVMGAFALRFWRTKITFFYFLFFLKVYTGTFAAPAWLMLGLWLLAQFALASGLWAFTSIGDMGNIAFEAHVAGFAFGIAVAFFVRTLAIEERFLNPS